MRSDLLPGSAAALGQPPFADDIQVAMFLQVAAMVSAVRVHARP